MSVGSNNAFELTKSAGKEPQPSQLNAVLDRHAVISRVCMAAHGVCVLALVVACSSEPRSLSDEDAVRVAAVVEATAAWATRPVCLVAAVGPGRDGDPFAGATDPSGPFLAAIERLGHVSAESRCVSGAGAVTLGRVTLTRGGAGAHLLVGTRFEDSGGELRLMQFRKDDGQWQVERTQLLSQE